jgi:hypothetical protein
MKRNSFLTLTLLATALNCGIFRASADTFTIDPTQSSLTISGMVFGIAFNPQGAGSLTTVYNGTIEVAQTAGTIQFSGGSLIAAQTSGSWKPLSGGGNGSAPADYGGLANVAGSAFVAFRSVLFDVTSDPIPVTSGQFDPSGLTFLFPTGSTSAIDYRYFAGSGTKIATGEGTNDVAALATISTAGNTQTLTIGVNVQFKFTLVSSGDTIVNVTGQIVATNSAAVVAPIVLQTPKVTNQVVTLGWQAPAGQLFQVQASSNLLAWQTNASNVTSASTNYTWSETNAAAKAFYRVAH